MTDPAQILKDFQPNHEFFVGIDSDGCVFDSMELKHKECFTPMFIKHFSLQPVCRYAREVWEFVNLYSKSRGINRFPALSNALNLLRERPEVEARAVAVPDTGALDAWLARETRLSNETLRAELDRGAAELEPVMAWSVAVDAAIEDIVKGVPPFALVRESLLRLQSAADVMVVSQTPFEALAREWGEHDFADCVALIAGQDKGSKTEQLKHGAGGKYGPHAVLMIGDAPGDFKAAKSNHALFYPVVPGREEESWQRFYDEALDRFLQGEYAGEYEAALLHEFHASLPELAPWEFRTAGD